jgi:hypothetical protein
VSTVKFRVKKRFVFSISSQPIGPLASQHHNQSLIAAVSNNCHQLFVAMKSNTIVSFRAATANNSKGTGNEDPPTLLSFPFGVPQSSDEIQLQAFEKNTSKKRKYILESDSAAGVNFQGSNYGVNNMSNDCTGFSIGVYDEGTGVVELHCVGHAFTMEQQGQEDDEVPAALSAASMTAMERRQSLTDTFGSKKKKRALRAAESNIISSQNIVAADTISEILTESIIGNDRKTAASSQLEADASSLPKSAMDQHREMMLPPFDASATVLKEAYPLVGGLVPRHVVRMLEEWVDSASSQMSGGGSAGDWQQRLDQDSYCQTVQDIFDLNISQLKDKKFKKGLGSLLLCDIMVRLAFQLSESSKPIVKETLEEKLSTPPPQLLRHLTDSFAVFKKSFGKSSFVSTKSLM